MNVNIDKEDIVIKRARNGWLAITVDSSCNKVIDVYSDSLNGVSASSSLYNLIKDQFKHYMKSHKTPGIELNLSETSEEEELIAEFELSNDDGV